MQLSNAKNRVVLCPDKMNVFADTHEKCQCGNPPSVSMIFGFSHEENLFIEFKMESRDLCEEIIDFLKEKMNETFNEWD